jgi:lipopolysaccharide transport system ATP-binding protein
VVKGFRRAKPTSSFWALRNVSFELEHGEMMGVVGPNGSGKSTLFRLIGGVLRPDEGHVRAQGRIGALFELGTGFHRDLTGRDNIFVNGVILGLTRREIMHRFDDIVAFAGLEEFVDSPLRTYSSGMQLRLAFSIAANTSPDILLIDEVLAVGDLSFQQKCLERVKQFQENGCAIILISHDLSQIRRLCRKTLRLKKGAAIAFGDSEMVIGQYLAETEAETRKRTPQTGKVTVTTSGVELRPGKNRFGSLELKITGVRLLGRNGLPASELQSGDPMVVEIEYRTDALIQGPIFGVSIVTDSDTPCFDTSTAGTGQVLPSVQGEGRIRLRIERLDLNAGSYFLDVGVYEKDWAYAYDYHWHSYPLTMRTARRFQGIIVPPHRWEMVESASLPRRRE